MMDDSRQEGLTRRRSHPRLQKRKMQRCLALFSLLLLLSFSSTTFFPSALAFQCDSSLRPPLRQSHTLSPALQTRQQHQPCRSCIRQKDTWNTRSRRHFSTTAQAMTPPDNDKLLSESSYQSSIAETGFSWLMMALPLVSLCFPFLLQVARSQIPGSSEQFTALAVLFASNRLYLYAMSTTIVGLVALRSAAQDRVSLGKRVVDLTEELLYSPPLQGSGSSRPRSDVNLPEQDEPTTAQEQGPLSTTTQSTTTYESSAMIQNLSTELGDSLDDVSSNTQAILLPVLVSALFASSFFFFKLLKGEGDNAVLDTSSADIVANLFQTYGPLLTTLWNGLILTLFTRCEVRRLLFSNNLLSFKQQQGSVAANDDAASLWVPWIVGAMITALAFAGQWQAQNFVNMALAILVARAIQINNLPAILGALSLLTLYDATLVLFLPAHAASLSDVVAVSTTTIATSSSTVAVAATASSDTILEQAAKSSAMGAVAIDKLTSLDFQPGLLVTKLQGRVGGALGLGDAVFPSLLAVLARRFDLQQHQQQAVQKAENDDKNASTSLLFPISMVGYLTGCLACELVPFVSTSGVPALLLIVPLMVGATLGTAAWQGNLDAFWEFVPE